MKIVYAEYCSCMLFLVGICYVCNCKMPNINKTLFGWMEFLSKSSLACVLLIVDYVLILKFHFLQEIMDFMPLSCLKLIDLPLLLEDIPRMNILFTL